MTTTLLLLRHAHTEANEAGSTPRMAGWCDIPLSLQGEAQLRRLEEMPFDGIAPVVYASTSPRALRTADAAAGGRTVVPLRSLREISCGEVEGWLVSDLARHFPELWQRNAAQDDAGFAWPGGESYEKFRQRILRALRAIAARHRGGRLLIVTHAGAIAQVVGHVKRLSPARWESYRPANCSVTILECEDDGTLRLVAFDRRIVEAVTPAAAARQRAG